MYKARENSDMEPTPDTTTTMDIALDGIDPHTPRIENGVETVVHQRRQTTFTREPANTTLASCRNWFSFWTLGTINNFAYVVILCAAANLADSFNDRKLTGFVTWANVAVGIGVRTLNMYFLHVPTNTRFICVALAFFVGYAILATSVYYNFWLSIFAIIAIGGACSFGESLLLGYMNNYPAQVTGGWSSGTGMAGVGGSAYYLLFWVGLHDQLHMDCTDALFIIFASLLPLTLIYLLVFMFGPTRPVGMVGGCTCADRDRDAADEEGTQNGDEYAGANTNVHTSARESSSKDEDTESSLNYPINRAATAPSNNTRSPLLLRPTSHTAATAATETYRARVFRLGAAVAGTSGQLLLVYFFEYVVSVAFAIHAPSYTLNGGWWCGNGYTVLQFCYQSGVLMSRSSLSFLRIKRIGWITFLQGLNFIGWLINAKYHFLSVGAQAVWMVWVGCMGGAMYVNVFANLVDDKTIANQDRELSINLVAMAMNGGIVLSAVFQIVADSTFLSGPGACAADTTAQCGANATKMWQ